ncbi:CPBP family intramembrane glutamic endopeptidase [Mucilaginibacter jinjuensis]|uniref:Type II CAAX endopeptidase family protein n=1 Tax=Mucilaginibacter jinjuensis TaxID=1176721 RepID=A0ABY7T7W9_9SPHI|nr:type II CAAX endopeptidase family protein [Mucilaginibacter jinjuensis]WCT12585.1 type II CAAX endopeptidase family protein [Mucilaginibacter jinjuensis]
MDKSQGWKNVLKIIIPYLIIVSVFELIGVYASGQNFYQNLPQTTLQTCVVSFSSMSGTLLTIWLFCKYIDGRHLIDLGFYDGYISRDVVYGLLMGLIIMIGGSALLLSVRQLSYEGINFNAADLCYSVLLYTFVAFTEELLLRGYVLNNFLDSFNKYIALALSAVIFSLMHGANPHIGVLPFVNLFLAGILLGMSYIFTRKLWFPMALHFSWNFCQGVLCGFHVSGQDIYSLTIMKRAHDTIWNGGKFGFEGSVTCIIFQLVAIAIVYKIYSSKTGEQPVAADTILQEAA